MSVGSVADVMDCLDGTLDEPKNSGRRVRMAMEAEIALKRSAAALGPPPHLAIFAWSVVG